MRVKREALSETSEKNTDYITVCSWAGH